MNTDSRFATGLPVGVPVQCNQVANWIFCKVGKSSTRKSIFPPLFYLLHMYPSLSFSCCLMSFRFLLIPPFMQYTLYKFCGIPSGSCYLGSFTPVCCLVCLARSAINSGRYSLIGQSILSPRKYLNSLSIASRPISSNSSR